MTCNVLIETFNPVHIFCMPDFIPAHH